MTENAFCFFTKFASVAARPRYFPYSILLTNASRSSELRCLGVGVPAPGARSSFPSSPPPASFLISSRRLDFFGDG